MKKIIKYLGLILFLYVAINFSCAHSNFLLIRSINNQINYIGSELNKGAGARLQAKYPEGFLFANGIFSLSLIEFSESSSLDLKEKSKVVDRCLKNMLSASAQANYDELLALKFGAFYVGWTNYTLKKYIESDLFIFSEYKQLFKSKHHIFNKAIIAYQKDSISLVETYSDAIWPADNLVCISSLPNEQLELKEKWLKVIEKSSINDLELINHDHYNPSIARGSSQALILYFLNDLDREKSILSNHIFKEKYINKYCGIQFVKEHIEQGEVDVDSGPIVLEYGSVATLMNIKTQSKFGIKNWMTWNFLNFLGLPINLFGKKCYLFKEELMFDIFMLWSSISLK